MGLAGYMEYYVQRHGGEYVFAYNLMAAGLGLVFLALALASVVWTIIKQVREKKAGKVVVEEEEA